jgi:hypothetical protein
VPETPGRKRDRGQQGFQIAGRHIDDQPLKRRKSLKIL